jgi:hypothetical protein
MVESSREAEVGEEMRPEVTDEAGKDDDELRAPAGEFKGTVAREGAADEKDWNEGNDKGEEFFFQTDLAAIGHELGGEKVLDGAKDEGEEALGDDGHRIRTGLRR